MAANPDSPDTVARVTLPSVAAPGSPPGETIQVRLKRTKDGDIVLPAATQKPDGTPRFVMPIPPHAAETDMGAAYMVRHELLHDGFERATREVVEAHLRPGDVFVDVGAHWGLMSFAAATRYPGNVAVVALEAHPENSARLFKGVQMNRLGEDVEVIAAAAGDRAHMAQIAFNTTMGHSLIEGPGRTHQGGKLTVPVVTVDQIMAERPALQQRPVILKIDVEGLEPEVIKGATELLRSTRVKLIVWEKGFDYRNPERRKAYDQMMNDLNRMGFGHFSFAWPEWGGILLPDVPNSLSYNVFSFSRQEPRLPHYQMRYAAYPPFNLTLKLPRDERIDEQLRQYALRLKATDGGRWAEYRAMTPDAEARAAAAAKHLKPGAMVLDLGCGAMALRPLMPPKARYTPADLVGRAPDCYLIDLNQAYSYVDELFPAAPTVEGRFDWITVLETLEFVHEPPRLFERCRKSSSGLILTYRTVEPGTGDAVKQERRRMGCFTEHSAAEIEAMLAAAGWAVASKEAVAGTTMWVCRAA